MPRSGVTNQRRKWQVIQLSLTSFTKGSFILMEGTPGVDKFYIIKSGNVRCTRANDTSGEGVKIYGPGDLVGVIACMSGHSQIENSIAETDCVLLAVSMKQYPDLIKENAPLAMKMIKIFAKRMREMNEKLTQLTLSTVAEETPEHIYDVANYYSDAGQYSVALFAYYQYLKACPQGQAVNDAKRKVIALRSKSKAVYLETTPDMTREYPHDTMIFSECQSGQEMFIVQSGGVKISKIVDGNEVTLVRLHKGDMFGEMALIESKPRSASAIAVEDCVLMVVNKQNFNQMVASQPQLIARLTNTLAARIWSMYRKFDNASLMDPQAKMLDMLAIQIEQLTSGKRTKELQTDLTLNDLVTMCGIPTEMQCIALSAMSDERRIQLVKGKIYVKDCEEVIKQASFNLKKNREKLQKAFSEQRR